MPLELRKLSEFDRALAVQADTSPGAGWGYQGKAPRFHICVYIIYRSLCVEPVAKKSRFRNSDKMTLMPRFGVVLPLCCEGPKLNATRLHLGASQNSRDIFDIK